MLLLESRSDNLPLLMSWLFCTCVRKLIHGSCKLCSKNGFIGPCRFLNTWNLCVGVDYWIMYLATVYMLK